MNFSRAQMIMIFIAVPWVWIVTAQFVTEPKKKTPSAAKVKEQCVQADVEQLEHIADIMELLGNVQRNNLKHITAVVENDKEHPLNKKNGAELQVCYAKKNALNESLIELKKELREYALFVSDLK